MILLPFSFRKPPHLLSSQLAKLQSGRPSPAPHLLGPLQLARVDTCMVTVGGYKGKTSTAALVVRILAAKIGIAMPVVPEVHVSFPDTNS